MKISFDKKADAFLIQLRDGRVSRDMKIAENVYAGFDRHGNLIDIEILEASEMETPWITLEAAAKQLQKSERTLLRWIKSGKIKPEKVGREYRIKASDLKKAAS